jgi:hypothetical protein
MALVCNAGCVAPVPLNTMGGAAGGSAPVSFENESGGRGESFWIAKYKDVIAAILRAGEALSLEVKLPAASRGASLAQLELKLRRPLLNIAMMHNIFLYNVTSHAIPDGTCEISVFPQLPRPQSVLQRRKHAEQFPGTDAFDDSNHLTDRTLWGKRHQDMNMLNADFHLNELKIIFFTYFADQLFRMFPDLVALKDFLSILRAPNQMIAGIINRMTRSLNCHAQLIS